jgi:hypothetical protein
MRTKKKWQALNIAEKLYAQTPRMKPRLPILLLASATLVACDRPAPTAEETRQVTATGAAAAKTLMDSLGTQLKTAIQGVGPAGAIGVCQQAAMPITAAAGVSHDGVSIRRTTLKPRNPANAPDEMDRDVLTRLSELKPPPAEIVEWQGDIARYYKPLVIQEICLNCHGDPKTFAPDLAAALKERYPDDLATGYALGDLRGVIRVDVPRP